MYKAILYNVFEIELRVKKIITSNRELEMIKSEVNIYLLMKP